MAKLPDANDLGRPGFAARRPIAQVDLQPIARAGEVMGDTIARAGQTAGGAITRGGVALAQGEEAFGVGLSKGLQSLGEGTAKLGAGIANYRAAQDDMALARAKADKQVRLARLDESLENDQDHTTLEERYTSSVAQINQDIEDGLGNPSLTERYRIWSDPQDAYMAGRMRSRVRKIESDYQVADANEKLQQLRDTGLKSPDPLQRTDVIDTGNELIAGLQRAGHISPVRAQDLRRRWAVDYATASFEMMPPQDRIGALSDVNNKASLVHFLPEDTRRGLLQKAQREALADRQRAESQGALDRFTTRNLINDDVAQVAATGEGADERLLSARIMRDYGQESLARWQIARQDAGDIWTASHDLYSLSETEIDQRLLAIAPKPGDENFARREAVYTAVVKRADAIRKQRNDDPATSVSEDPAVKEAFKVVDQKDVATQQALFAARLAAQERAGVPEDARSPITKAEAMALTVPLRRMLPGQERAALTEMGEEFQRRFGEHADIAFQYALRVHRVDAATAQTATRVMKRLGLGQSAESEDARRVDADSEVAAAQRATGAPSWLPGSAQDAAVLAQRLNPLTAAVPVAGDIANNVFGSGTTRAGDPSKPLPPQADIKALLANPKLADRFDKKWGAGSAKKLLDTYTVR